MKDEQLLSGLFKLIKHGNEIELKKKELAQKESQLRSFTESSNQQTQIYSKQLDLFQRQIKIQENQNKILNRTLITYIILAFIALINVIFFGIDVYFKYFK